MYALYSVSQRFSLHWKPFWVARTNSKSAHTGIYASPSMKCLNSASKRSSRKCFWMGHIQPTHPTTTIFPQSKSHSQKNWLFLSNIWEVAVSVGWANTTSSGLKQSEHQAGMPPMYHLHVSAHFSNSADSWASRRLGEMLLLTPAVMVSLLFGDDRAVLTTLGMFSDYPGVSIHSQERNWFYLIISARNGEDNNRGTLPGSANDHLETGRLV